MPPRLRCVGFFIMGRLMRVNFYIDGFNLYHSLTKDAKGCKWLDLHKLCLSYLKESETLSQIYYFTALAIWNIDKIRRHKVYIKALESTGVKVIFGKFKKIEKECTKQDVLGCDKHYKTFAEKQTDVNIAMQVFEDAFKDNFDTAIIVSGDSDLVPPIKKIKENFPNKRVGVLSPIARDTKELRKTADFANKITKNILLSSLFPKTLTYKNELITCPPSWQSVDAL